jgi:fucose permease
VAGAVGVAAGPPRAVQLAAMTAMGLGTALVWARVRHRTLTVIPGRAATVSSLVGTFSGVAAIVPPAVGLLADRVGLTAGLVALALCAVPLWAVVAALGGDDPVRTDRGR